MSPSRSRARDIRVTSFPCRTRRSATSTSPNPKARKHSPTVLTPPRKIRRLRSQSVHDCCNAVLEIAASVPTGYSPISGALQAWRTKVRTSRRYLVSHPTHLRCRQTAFCDRRLYYSCLVIVRFEQNRLVKFTVNSDTGIEPFCSAYAGKERGEDYRQ